MKRYTVRKQASGYSGSVRSRLFGVLEVRHVRGIDATARAVGGAEDPE